ncbi:MAG: C4-dicarboxylate TRAP transporter substrate-binding protein [Deltaproteobacteria bacterium]|nr:C4-dicarboxylate TRAP transporter substrate-binding protein [Deltaproteobacteria bacterium]MBW2297246.1 C4-dicarboxylate TRAP transporter substrate-binding protein [Deltaproteobacteria bacterium]MBW2614228.1 C4-dicarboxylate TRAP transporter substrate-binding protein [Deltaproteobacteria bacterium]MBW2677810.1 C4-dicarboxylate TRAP transporter substrate-binding protein [Deltaproteobacteria bacterium]
MKIAKISVMILVMLAVTLTMPMAPAHAKTYKLTAAAGHPPIFLWVTLTRDFFIPEVDRRLAEAGDKDKITWNQAYGGTVAKLGGVLEAVEEGIVDVGFVGTIFEAPKMPLHNVSYMTPFGSGDIFKVVDTMSDLQEKIPAVANEWTKYNQVYLGGVGLDTYGILTNFPVNTVDDIDGHKIAAPGPSANWIKGTGAVAVAANLNTYYNGIKTGVFEGTLTFMTAGAAIKVYEVAPHICMVNFGAQFAGGLSVNKDVFDDFPDYMQKIFLEVGAQYADKLAQAQADKAAGAMKAMEEAGAKVLYLSDAERKRWAEKLPNVPMNWAESMEQKGLPGKKVLQGYLDGLRQRGTVLVRDWDK